MVAQTANLSCLLETVNDKNNRLDIDDIYVPDTSVIVLAHEDLRKAGLKEDYDSGKIVSPDGQTMKMQSTVWTIPAMMEKQVQAFNTVVAPQPRNPFIQLQCYCMNHCFPPESPYQVVWSRQRIFMSKGETNE